MIHRYLFCFIMLLKIVLINNLHAQDCLPPKNVTVSDISSCSAEVHWTPVAGNQFKVAYKLSSNSKWSSFIPLSSASSFTFSGLLPNKNYDFQAFSKSCLLRALPNP